MMKKTWFILLAVLFFCLTFSVGCSCGDDDDDTTDDDTTDDDTTDDDTTDDDTIDDDTTDDDTIDDDTTDDDTTDDDTTDDDTTDDDTTDDDTTDDDTTDDDTTDDDTTDDDTTDDDTTDDDTTDDDTTDDDTVEESYIYDNGTYEEAYSAVVAGFMMAITMSPSGYPAYLEEVSAFVADFGVWGSSFQMLILADENGNGPDHTEIVYTSTPMQAVAGDTWVVLDLIADGFATPLNSGDWIVAVEWLETDGPYIGFDEDTVVPTCYYYDNVDWDVLAVGGIVMIRGEGYYIAE